MRNMNTKICFLLLISLLLTSCWTNTEENNSNTGSTSSGTIWVTIDKVEQKQKNNDIKYDEKKNELKIWEVFIKPGVPENFPKEITIYNDSKTYVNSNVASYLYFVLDKKTDLNVVWKYYIDLFQKLWYKRKVDKNLPLNKEDLSNLEFQLENKDYIPFEKRTEAVFKKLEKDWKLDKINNQYEREVKVYIKKETPENIQKWMWLDWVFVEIYY